MDEDYDGGGTEEGFCGGERGFRIFPETPVSADPDEEALDDPAARMDGEADLVRRLLDDLDGDDGGSSRLVAGVTVHDGLAVGGAL